MPPRLSMMSFLGDMSLRHSKIIRYQIIFFLWPSNSLLSSQDVASTREAYLLDQELGISNWRIDYILREKSMTWKKTTWMREIESTIFGGRLRNLNHFRRIYGRRKKLLTYLLKLLLHINTISWDWRLPNKS